MAKCCLVLPCKTCLHTTLANWHSLRLNRNLLHHKLCFMFDQVLFPWCSWGLWVGGLHCHAQSLAVHGIHGGGCCFEFSLTKVMTIFMAQSSSFLWVISCIWGWWCTAFHGLLLWLPFQLHPHLVSPNTWSRLCLHWPLYLTDCSYSLLFYGILPAI